MDDSGAANAPTADGCYMLAGTTSSNNGDVVGNHGVDDVWVVKVDGAGAPVWQRVLGGRSYDVGYSVRQVSDGGYVAAGASLSGNGNVSLNQGGADA